MSVLEVLVWLAGIGGAVLVVGVALVVVRDVSIAKHTGAPPPRGRSPRRDGTPTPPRDDVVVAKKKYLDDVVVRGR